MWTLFHSEEYGHYMRHRPIYFRYDSPFKLHNTHNRYIDPYKNYIALSDKKTQSSLFPSKKDHSEENILMIEEMFALNPNLFYFSLGLISNFNTNCFKPLIGWTVEFPFMPRNCCFLKFLNTVGGTTK